MVVVVAHRDDGAAERLVAQWPGGARLLTCADLSTPGWRLRRTDPADDSGVAGGQLLYARQVTGVLVRCPCIHPSELHDIAPAEREYVAAEMTAFLAAWLSGLRCPVLNRPVAICLCGPTFRPLQWLHLAQQQGIPIADLRCVSTSAPSPLTAEQRPCSVTVIGDRCLGTPDEALQQQARMLARAAGVGLLRVDFTAHRSPAARLCGASVLPELSDPEVVRAVQEHLGPAGGPP